MKLNRKQATTFGAAALLTVGFTLLTGDVLAQAATGDTTAGSNLLKAGADMMESNYGLFAGLIVAALGLWRWLMSQDSWGVMLILGGIVITAFPGIFEGLYKGTSGFFKAAGSGVQDYSARDITDGTQTEGN